MAKETRQPFTPTGEYHARRGFRFHGRDYAPGDEFPWKQLSCSARKLRLLYEGRFIEPGPAPVEEEPEAPPVETETAPPETDEGKQDEDPGSEEQTEDPGDDEEKGEPEEDPDEKKDPETFTFNPKQHVVKSAGSGKWKVTTKGGKFRLYITRKEAQRLKKVKKPTEVRPEEIVE